MNNLRGQKKGLTLIEIIIAVAILAVLMTIAVPNFMGIRARVRRDACINNLRQIKLAKEQWALEKDKDYTNTPAAADLDAYVKDGTASLKCPLDPANTFATSYTINNVGTDPVCKISGGHRL